MKEYDLITISCCGETFNFHKGIIGLHSDEAEINVEKSIENLGALLDMEVAFVTVGNSYKFYVPYEALYGVE